MPRPGRLTGCLAVVLFAMGLLAGCARPVRDSVSMNPSERRTALESVTRWEARGRIALKAPGASGQGNFSWIQTGELTVLRVAGPFGAGGYEIRWEPARLTVLSGRGEVAADYAGPDAAARFLEEQLGWSLPVANTRYWLRGLAGPDTPAAETLDEMGLLVALAQDGWDVSYGEYGPAGGVLLPSKLVLTSPAGRIRLVVDQWDF